MFYSATFKDKYTKEQAFTLKADLIDKLSKVVTIQKDSHRHDITMVLPNGQTVYSVVILSDEPWGNLITPIKVFTGAHIPQVIWFAETDSQTITRIDSLKTPLFKYLATGLIKPVTRKETDDFKVTFVPGDGTYIKISNSVFENNGFSVDPLRSYLIEPDALLDEKTGFGYLQFDPKLGNVDDAFWWYIHILSSLQNSTNSSYAALWPRYQEYLTR